MLCDIGAYSVTSLLNVAGESHFGTGLLQLVNGFALPNKALNLTSEPLRGPSAG